MSVFFTSKFHTGDPCLPLESGSEVVIILADSKALMGSKFKVRKATVSGPMLIANKKSGAIGVLIAVNVESAKSPGKTYLDMVHPMQVMGNYTDELYEKIKTLSAQSQNPEDFISLVMNGKGAGEVLFDKTAKAEDTDTPVDASPVPAPEKKAAPISSLLDEAPEVVNTPAPTPTEAAPSTPKPAKEFSLADFDLSIFGPKSNLLN